MSSLWEEKWGKETQKRPSLSIKQIRDTMHHVLRTNKVHGPMELVYKTAKVHGIETLPYHTFTLWKGLAEKLISCY